MSVLCEYARSTVGLSERPRAQPKMSEVEKKPQKRVSAFVIGFPFCAVPSKPVLCVCSSFCGLSNEVEIARREPWGFRRLE